MSDAFTRMQDLLRQLFQFESKELDFGSYRIMNHIVKENITRMKRFERGHTISGSAVSDSPAAW